MVLSKSDLMFSTIVATWSDGREQIEDFLKALNNKGEGFAFHTDFLMRSCLVLSDLHVLFKVHSFKAQNVLHIMQNWERIKRAIDNAVDLLVKWGFSKETLTSQNVIILIAYHFYKGGDNTKESIAGLHKYLMHSLLQNIYGGQGDQIIAAFRNALRREKNPGEYELISPTFSFEAVKQAKLPGNKTLEIKSEDIDDYLENRKGPQSFFVLSLLYPSLRFSEVFFHQDHIHPSAMFTLENFRSLGISEEEQRKWLSTKDCVPNLQLMEKRVNISKSDKPFKDWFYGTSAAGVPNVLDSEKFLQDNYISSDIDLSFESYMVMYERRRETLRGELHRILNVIEEPKVDKTLDLIEGDLEQIEDYPTRAEIDVT